MIDAARQVFDSLATWKAVEELIARGEAEGVYLECKAPTEPRVNRDLQDTLGRVISGFANTAGGVLICGVSTTKHSHSNLDVLTQIEPIGTVASFDQQLRRVLPTLTMPPQLTCVTRILKRTSTDTRGMVVLHVAPTSGDPVLRLADNVFYFRSGDEFRPAPYEVIRRLFAATDVPDLSATFDPRLVQKKEDGSWEVPIVLVNRSNAAATDVEVSLSIFNPEACEAIEAGGFSDASEINPGVRIYWAAVSRPVHRGVAILIGRLQVRMKVGRRPRRVLRLRMCLYATRMRAREIGLTIQLAKKGFTVRADTESYLH